MIPLRRRPEYDRRRILEEAARARARNRRRKAIALYRWILAVERNNAELHARLAPLLAETGQHFDAWNSYRTCAQAALREGRDERALAVYREAAKHLPQEIQVWQGLARLLARRGDEPGAVETLIEGSRQFRSTFLRPQAISLLRRARTIDPWNFETIIELSRNLARADQSDEARILLDGLAGRSSGAQLRRVRAAQLRIEGSPSAAWRWLRAVLGPEQAAGPRPVVRGVVPLHARSARR